MATRNRSLEEAPAKALVFLRTIGMNADIRATMSKYGYSAEAHAMGWSLLEKTSGFTADGATSNPVGDAIKQLSDWNGVGFHRIHAALAHLHPEQESLVFKDLESATGVAAVLSVATLLARIDILDGIGPEAALRKDKAEADKKALATLASRGIDETERKRLADLVKTAQSAPMPTAEVVSAGEAALLALKGWYDDWSETAKAVLEKRGDLIKLGLAKRISRTSDDSSDTATGGSATPPAPSVTLPGPSAPAPGPSATPPAGSATPPPPVATPTPPPAAPLMATNGMNGHASYNPVSLEGAHA